MNNLQELSKRILCHLHDCEWGDRLANIITGGDPEYESGLKWHKEGFFREIFLGDAIEYNISLSITLCTIEYDYVNKSYIEMGTKRCDKNIFSYDDGYFELDWKLTHEGHELYLHDQKEETIDTLLELIPEYE